MNNLFYPKEWFFVVMQILSAIITVYALFYHSDMTLWFISLLGYFLITCLGITVTFHRLLAHKSFQLTKSLEYLFSFFGNLGCTGSSIGWVFVHRTHHIYADKPGDPHSPVVLGPTGAFIGDYGGKFNKWMVKDIVSDPVHRFMHKYYILLIVSTCLLISLFDMMLAIHLFWIPIFLNTMASRLSNWIDHSPLFGSKPYKNNDQSHNVWWWSLLTFGEGWHNNHHKFPGDYRIGRKWHQFDIGRYVIDFLMIIHLAKKRIS
jgi:fatty-acid desaturase